MTPDVKLKYLSVSSQTLKFNPNKDMLGEGGFSYVYRARYNNDYYVAVKRFKTDTTHVPSLYENNMRKEARCLRNLLHPNIVQLVGIVWEPNFHAVVLEYVANGDLLQFLHKESLHPYLKAKLLWDISKGVNYLHWLPKKIIHNDLKASNILISDYITAKITDFGMADWNSFTTQIMYSSHKDERLQGATSTHISPERWKNINYSDIKCDVYSYGILIWETYSERKPFTRVTNDEIKLAVIDGQRPDENLLPSNMPSAMSELMRQCWHQQPHMRPEMHVIMEMFENILSRDEEIKGAINFAISSIVGKLTESKVTANNNNLDTHVNSEKIVVDCLRQVQLLNESCGDPLLRENEPISPCSQVL